MIQYVFKSQLAIMIDSYSLPRFSALCFPHVCLAVGLSEGLHKNY